MAGNFMRWWPPQPAPQQGSGPVGPVRHVLVPGPQGAQGPQGPPGGQLGVQGVGGGVNANVGAPQQGTAKKPSDQRFRSFAERYIVARAHLFRVPPNEHAQDQWDCIMDAKRAYAMIERTGRNIEPEDGTF